MSSLYKKSFKQQYIESVELSVYNCGMQKCEPLYTWGPGVRDHYLIHYVISGEGTFETQGRVHNVASGDVFFAKPGEIITYTANKNNPWEYYWVGFNGPYANKIMLQLPFSNEKPTHKCENAQEIEKIMENIFTSRGTSTFNEALMVGNLYIFLANLMKACKHNEQRNVNSSAQYVKNAIQFIQFNYSNDIGIDDISRNIGVSRSHLYRVFINNVGQSPIDYLTGYRINEACYLLKNSTLSIAEIAVSVGFFDQFYFSRVFKKAKGVPPSKYLSTNDKLTTVVQTE